MAEDLTNAQWRKSTRSGDNNGNCVEVATNLPGIVAVRDSKDPAGTAVVFTSTAWTSFTQDVTNYPSTHQSSH
ncbi:DUF397 domain-containing protein [Micromonospora echinospora]|uniref:DUF397 domain-containing protein n=1 Tax=Micromonospora echinospora TaxID=1877 RepID=UPI00378DED89